MPIFNALTKQQDIDAAKDPKHTELLIQDNVKRNIIDQIPVNIHTLHIYCTLDHDIIRHLSGDQFSHITKFIIYPNSTSENIAAVIRLIPARIKNIQIAFGGMGPKHWDNSILTALKERGLNPNEAVDYKIKTVVQNGKDQKCNKTRNGRHLRQNNSSNTGKAQQRVLSHQADNRAPNSLVPTIHILQTETIPLTVQKGAQVFSVPPLSSQRFTFFSSPSETTTYNPDAYFSHQNTEQQQAPREITLNTINSSAKTLTFDLLTAKDMEAAVAMVPDEISESSSYEMEIDENKLPFQVLDFSSASSSQSTTTYIPRGGISIAEIMNPPSPADQAENNVRSMRL